jgi:hypothetical protein
MRRSLRRGLCLARLHCSISCISAGFFGQRRLWSRWPAYSYRGSASFLNCHLFSQIPNFCKLLVSKNIFVSWSKQSSGTTFPDVILRLWENVSTNVAGLGTNRDVALGDGYISSVRLKFKINNAPSGFVQQSSAGILEDTNTVYCQVIEIKMTVFWKRRHVVRSLRPWCFYIRHRQNLSRITNHKTVTVNRHFLKPLSYASFILSWDGCRFHGPQPGPFSHPCFWINTPIYRDPCFPPPPISIHI